MGKRETLGSRPAGSRRANSAANMGGLDRTQAHKNKNKSGRGISKGIVQSLGEGKFHRTCCGYNGLARARTDRGNLRGGEEEEN